LVVNNSKHIFLENNWNLVVSVSGTESHQSFSQRLSTTLKVKDVVKVVAEFQLKPPLKFPLTVECQLVKQLTVPSSADLCASELPSGLVCVDVASLPLDLTHFISPVSVEPVHEYRLDNDTFF